MSAKKSHTHPSISYIVIFIYSKQSTQMLYSFIGDLLFLVYDLFSYFSDLCPRQNRKYYLSSSFKIQGKVFYIL